MSDERDELLERSVAAMRDAAVPDGPSPEVVARTLAALGGAGGEKRLVGKTLFARIRAMRFVTKMAAAVLLAIGFGFLAVLTLRPGSVAWADVVGKVADAKALTFRTTTPLPGTDKVMVQRFWLGSDGRQRVEDGDGKVTIIDAKAGIELSLDAKAKRAHRLRSKPHSYGFPNDPLQSLKELKGEKAREIGQKDIGGRKVKGFAVTAGGADYVVWADAASGDPVRVEWTLLLWTGKTTMVMDEIALDPKVDPVLFDTTPPKGYEVVEVPGGEEPAAAATRSATTRAATGPVAASNVATATAADVAAAEDRGEDHVVGVLRLYAERNSGKFPAKLDDWAAYAKLAKREPLTEADVMLTTHAFGLKAFLETLGENGWKYSSGATAGDKARVVFEYVDRETNKRRAVYADLSVKEVESTERK